MNEPRLRVVPVALVAGHGQVTRGGKSASREQVLGSDRLPFGEDTPAVIADEQVGFLRRISVDHAGSKHIDAVATAKSVGDFQDAVGSFGERVRQSGVEVGEHLFVPVIDRSTELDELRDVRELDLPILKSPFCSGSAGAVPNVVERLFRFPGSLQCRRVGQPSIEDELGARGQSVSALLEQEATFHRRPLRLHRGELPSGRDAYRVKMLVCSSDDVELVYDNNGLRKVDRCQFGVGSPHVHRHVAHSLPTGQVRHPVSDAGFAVRLQKVDHLSTEHVNQNRAEAIRQVHLVDAENLRSVNVPRFQHLSDMFALDVPARLLVDPNVSGDVQRRADERLHGDVVVTPQRHSPVGSHVRKALEEGAPAFPALVSLHRNVDHGLLSMNRSVNVLDDLRPVADEAADDTALRTCFRCDVVAGLNVILLVDLHFGHRPVRKIECIVCHGRPFGATHTAFGLTCGVCLSLLPGPLRIVESGKWRSVWFDEAADVSAPDPELHVRIALSEPDLLHRLRVAERASLQVISGLRSSPLQAHLGHPFHTLIRNQDITSDEEIHTLFRKAVH